MAKTGKDVEDFALLGGCVAHAVGCKQGKPQAACDLDRALIHGFVSPQKLSLQFDIDAVAPENLDKLFCGSAPFANASVLNRLIQRAAFSPRQTDETIRPCG